MWPYAYYAAGLAAVAAAWLRLSRRSAGDWSLRGKVVLITGASGGIGKEAALQCARAGADVALLARREDVLAGLAKECLAAGAGRAVGVKCDVTDRKACERAVKEAAKKLGALDVVVLNAGQSQGCYFEDIKNLDDADYLMQLNVTGVYNVLHYALPHVTKAASSRLVFVSSVAGTLGVPLRTIYCASKWAVNGLAAALRVELADAYGAAAPAVVVTCPPEVRSDLNGNRLQFGAGTPAESMQHVLLPTEPSVAKMLDGVARAERTHFFSTQGALVGKLYALLGAKIDKVVAKAIKKTHVMNGQGR